MKRGTLPLLAFVALLGLGLSMLLGDAAVPVRRHVLFAAALMPLMLGAMLYFVPVLTRSPAASGAVATLPVTALLIGVFTVLAMYRHPQALAWLAGAGLMVVLLESAWILARQRHTLGDPHPGLFWYQWALVALLLALLAIPLRVFWPAYAVEFRLFHLHLNLLGFLGLTALGTLRVLLPTVLGQPDSAAAGFLRKQLPLALVGSLSIAAGAAFSPVLAVLGGLLWLGPALLLLAVVARAGKRCLTLHAASSALAAAILGWLLVLGAGLAHAVGRLSADRLFDLLVYLFLLPLLTGATSYLLPIWRWPGRQIQAHAELRDRLTRFSLVRVLAFYLSALLSLIGLPLATVPAFAALAAYLSQVVFGIARVRVVPG